VGKSAVAPFGCRQSTKFVHVEEFAALRSTIERHLPEALRFLEGLVAVNSFTGNRAGVLRNAELIAAQFRELGFAEERVPPENPLFGDHQFFRRSGKGRGGVLLVTHLDTVYPEEEEKRHGFNWQVESGRIYGPGVNDNKGGTVMIWLVLSALRDFAPEIFESLSWQIAANAAEEELVRDFPQLCRARMPRECRAALVFEACSGSGQGMSLARCRKGSANMRVSVEGRGAHAGSRHREGANAIVEIAHVIEQIARLTDYSRELTVNVGSIKGGGPANRVPHFAECDVNIRAFDEGILQAGIDAVFALQDEPASVRAVSDGFACRVKVSLLNRNSAWPEKAKTDDLIELWMQTAQRLGLALRAEPRGGLSDGNYLSRFVPTLDGLGPFGLNGHSSERNPDGSKLPECVVVSSFLEMAAVNVAAICELAHR
jgi:glutamate carboxypeptidase